MPKTFHSPTQVNEFPDGTYAKLPKFAESIPSSIRIHISSWMFMKHHVFCAKASINEIPASLRNFDVTERFGREIRTPKLVVKDGRTLPIFVFMAKGISGCSCCWLCCLCGLPLCVDPDPSKFTIGLTCMPCQPLDKSEEKLIPYEWDQWDYLLYYLSYLTKTRSLDSPFHPNQYRKDFGGRAEELFYENALSYPNGIQILDYLHSLIDLGEVWEERKKALL